MGSPTVNVVRYTALFTGVAYGWYHRRTLQAAHDVHKIEAAAHQREHLIAQAKEAWIKKQQAPKAGSLVTDPDDPRFDLEKLIKQWEATA
ncbi:ATP synthase subunit e, mitochondrial [Mycena indigotica]|uniref:ATP synthase F(0) complex subunit e, mitochondrial n=1 Tax=Mycena indigotica TaxID=2126181 RepID=A0A8H6W766_9AGAR|nr:ATP synthase subunit e, mitochondrial [Mycena indigotica]KAF7307367.1 ATP synthase subunit e, mitochondrial [Mycena indigotica]